MKKQAFSLVEILAVMAFIGVLAAFLYPRIAGYMSKAKVKSTQLALNALKTDLELYNTDNGKYPTTAEGLEVIVSDAKQLKDGFGKRFEYNSPPLRFKDMYNDYEIISYGPDKKESDDDIHVGQ